MKTDRWFYSAVGAGFLVLMLLGFRAFVTSATGAEGRVIDPAIFRLDAIHGLAIAAWYVLFFVQSLLIGVRRRRLHFKPGWSAVGVALAIVVTGPWVAIRSVQITPPNFQERGSWNPTSREKRARYGAPRLGGQEKGINSHFIPPRVGKAGGQL